MAFLTREDILEVDDRKYETVPCPEWGGDVRLRSISGTQRDAFEESLIKTNGNDRKVNMRNARAKLIILCAVDEDGRALFAADDLNALGRKNAAPLDRLFDVCQKLTGTSDGDLERMTEDFGVTPDDEPASA